MLVCTLRKPRVVFVGMIFFGAVAFSGGVGGAAAELRLLPDEIPVTSDDREHWSFRPLAQVDIPQLESASWCRNAVDSFILQRIRKKGLEPAAEARRAELLRRVTFDLTGLPPTPQELEAFLSDDRPDAYERVVDRLLASPGYGEKWGQHWLDLARFAETDGYEHDKVRDIAWQYRDWVITSLNEDFPYDRFVTLQIAGDEVMPKDRHGRRPTGFCLAGPDMPDINSQEERRHVLLNEITATVGTVFLGLQLGCAQCHDHKYDPISLADFYRLRACFEPSLTVQKDKSVAVFQGASSAAMPSRVYLRGDWRRPGPEIEPAFPRIANPWNESVSAEAPAKPEGRRLALAKWLTRPDHPLVTRVLVNRLWQYHFGHGLSRTPSDFGLLSDEPLHLELLDWLATELVRRGWSLKQMHRLLVSSATYRQSSRTEARLDLDPDNLYFARFDRRRLTGEELRDAMFLASETLETARGGRGVMPPLPEELKNTLLKDHWTVSPRLADHYRRSIYVFARRNLRYPIFEVFDRPDANASCPERSRSTTAPQSLHLLNSEVSLDAARRLAGHVLATAATPTEQVQMAFVRVLSRPPKADELSHLLAFLHQQQELLDQESRAEESLAVPIPAPEGSSARAGAAFTDLCLALFNLNEFVYVD